MTGGRSPLHMGGPLGLAGLALLAGLSGFAIFAQGGDAPAAPPTRLEPRKPVPVPVQVTPPKPKLPAPIAPEQAQINTTPVEALPLPPKRKPSPRPKTLPLPTTDTAPVQPARETTRTAGQEVTFIVRLKGVKDADAAASAFHKDRAAADKAYAALVKARPGLSGFRLAGASYSGELKLSYTLPSGEASHAAVQRLQEKLLAVDGVSYADPDSVVHPGKK